MKPVLAWVKKNLMIVISVAVPLIVLPVALFFSMSWNSKIRTTQEKAASEQLSKITSTKVNYQLPEVVPNVKAVSLSTEPNDRITEHFRTLKEQLTQTAQELNRKALDFNRRTPLMEGVFPRAASREDLQNKSLEFTERIIGGAGRPGVYQTLFESAGAGGTVPAAQMRTLLVDAREREEERIRQGQGSSRQITPEETAEIRQKLIDIRKSEYVRRANEISFYAEPAAVLSGNAIPASMPTSPPGLEQLFRWQYDYWVIADLVEAIKRVNAQAPGVPGAVVKRIESIRVFDRVTAGAGASATRTENPEEAGGGGGGAEVFNQPAPVNFRASITGRFGSPSNQVYDTRYADLNLIVSSARLPQFFDALASVNFMTVIGCDLEAVDPWAELEQGFYYGDEPVVRAKIRVETIWLREWVAPLMPTGIRKLYAVAYSEPEAPANPADSASAEGDPGAGDAGGGGGGDGGGGRGGRGRGGGGG